MIPQLIRSRRRAVAAAKRCAAVCVLALTGGLLTACTFSTSSAPSSSAPRTASGPLSAPTLAKVKQLVHEFYTKNRTPGVLVGIWSPQGTFVSATGVSDLATGAPLKTDMQFKLASQAKAFTANIILQLIGEGKISLEDHISRWVAGVPGGDQITIRELLNMTSGLSTGFLLHEANVIKAQTTGCTEQDVLAAGAATPVVAEPGAVWSYSNYGYDLLGRVVELVTGQNISTAIRDRITVPLGLKRTLLPTSGNGLTEPFTHGYGVGTATTAQAPAVVTDDATAYPQSCLGASGGMVSTLSDLHVWVKALATGALLKPAVWKQAQTNPIPYAFHDAYNGPGLWLQGLGFVESGGFLGKEGSYSGYESISMYSPARHTTIEVVSTKQPNPITPTRMFQALAMAIYGNHIGFGLTPAQAMSPTYTGASPNE